VPEKGRRKPPPLKRSHSIGGSSIRRPATTNYSDTSDPPGKSTGCIKNWNWGDFFMFFRAENFFSKILKITNIGVILCGKSIARIPEA
jgi:hypothetical protein